MSSPSSADAGAGDRPRGVALLGSTGSIGRQTVEVLDAHPEAFRVVALATGSNAGLLAEQAARLRPAAVALGDGSGPRRAGPAVRHGARRRGGRARAAGDPRRRRPRRGRDGRRRQPPAGPGGAAGRQGRRDGQQGDARRRRPPGDATRPRARRGAGRDPSGRPVRQPAGLAAGRSIRSTPRSGSRSSASRWRASPR